MMVNSLLRSRPINEHTLPKRHFGCMTSRINVRDAEANTTHPEEEVEVIFLLLLFKISRYKQKMLRSIKLKTI